MIKIYEASEKLGIDREKMAIGGNSAGSLIAAVVAQRCRDANIRLCLQTLAVPAVDNTAVSRDYSTVISDRYPSWSENATVPGLPLECMAWIYRSFIGPFRGPELDNVS